MSEPKAGVLTVGSGIIIVSRLPGFGLNLSTVSGNSHLYVGRLINKIASVTNIFVKFHSYGIQTFL